MPQSKALSKFDKTYGRAYGMVGRHWEIFEKFVEDDDQQEWDETHDDLFRAAIVLAVTAMDSYFANRFCEGLSPYLENHKLNKNLMKTLEDAGFNTIEALGMFQMRRPRRRLHNLVKNNLDELPFQNLKKVDDLYKGFGYDSITKRAQGLARRKTLVATVQSLVNRRNKIVHRGDYNSHGRLNEVKYAPILSQMNDPISL
jgi:hypothetical protein